MTTTPDGSSRLERAARALLEQRDARLAALKGTEDEDRPDARGFAWGALTSAESREEAAAVALRAALDAAPEPAQAMDAVAALLEETVSLLRQLEVRRYGPAAMVDQERNMAAELDSVIPRLRDAIRAMQPAAPSRPGGAS